MWTVICDKDDGIRVVDRKRVEFNFGYLVFRGVHGEVESISLPKGIDSIDDLPLFGTMRGATKFLVDYYSN